MREIAPSPMLLPLGSVLRRSGRGVRWALSFAHRVRVRNVRRRLEEHTIYFSSDCAARLRIYSTGALHHSEFCAQHGCVVVSDIGDASHRVGQLWALAWGTVPERASGQAALVAPCTLTPVDVSHLLSHLLSIETRYAAPED